MRYYLRPSSCRVHAALAVLAIIIPLSLHAQENFKAHRVDTLSAPRPLIDAKYLFAQPNAPLFLSMELTTPPGYFSSIVFQPSAAQPFFFSRREAEPADLTGPLKLQLARQQRYSTMYTILGAVQAGGTAYLAYKYLKKHGLK